MKARLPARSALVKHVVARLVTTAVDNHAEIPGTVNFVVLFADVVSAVALSPVAIAGMNDESVYTCPVFKRQANMQIN